MALWLTPAQCLAPTTIAALLPKPCADTSGTPCPLATNSPSPEVASDTEDSPMPDKAASDIESHHPAAPANVQAAAAALEDAVEDFPLEDTPLGMAAPLRQD